MSDERIKGELKEGARMFVYAREMNEKIKEDKDYVKNQLTLNSEFEIPLSIKQIWLHVNEKYLLPGDKPVGRTTICRYGKIGFDKRKKDGKVKISSDLPNTMRLHMKVQQLSRNGQASGFMVRTKLAAAVHGT